MKIKPVELRTLAVFRFDFKSTGRALGDGMAIIAAENRPAAAAFVAKTIGPDWGWAEDLPLTYAGSETSPAQLAFCCFKT